MKKRRAKLFRLRHADLLPLLAGTHHPVPRLPADAELRGLQTGKESTTLLVLSKEFAPLRDGEVTPCEEIRLERIAVLSDLLPPVHSPAGANGTWDYGE